MPGPWQSALDRPSVRDTAMLAEVLRSLQQQLDGHGEGQEPTPAEVEDLVSHAVAELQRLKGSQFPGGIAPTLGAGVVQELLRQRRSRPSGPVQGPSKVDAKR